MNIEFANFSNRQHPLVSSPARGTAWTKQRAASVSARLGSMNASMVSTCDELYVERTLLTSYR